MKLHGAIAAAAILGLLATGSRAQSSPWEKIRLGEQLQSLKFGGDLRLRNENFDRRGLNAVDRNRSRFRLRLGAEAQLPHDLLVNLRLGSGTGEQVSTNQSFDNLSSQKEIWIDQVSLRWSPRLAAGLSTKLEGGRMPNPFWRTYTSDLVWDDDLNPEGFAQSLKWMLGGNVRLFGNMLQMVADEDSGTTSDQWMFGQQLGADFMTGDLRWKLAGAYYGWTHANASTLSQAITLEGNRRSGGVLTNRFGVGEATAELGYRLMEVPISLQGTFIKNLRARDITPKEDTGYQMGGRIGKAAAPGSVELAYFFKWVEMDATVADVADADFGDGGTNRKGHILWAAYNPQEWLQFKLKYFITQVLNRNLAASTAHDINRLQADLSVKF